MKRGAERQLAKDDAEDEFQDDESEPGQGFRKADDSILATRKIRSLPRRSLASTPTGTPGANGASSNNAPSTPKPDAFPGFGSPAGSPHPFNFTPTASPASPFGVPSSSSSSASATPLAFSFSPSPAVATSASSATKTFASFLGASTSRTSDTPSGSSSQPPPATKTDPASEAEAADSAAVKYYTALRGINVAFLSALSRAVEEDPFVNASEILEQYSKLRISIQKDFDTATKTEPPKPPVASMPAPPTTFAGFAGAPSVSAKLPTPSLGGGFTPKTDGSVPLKSGFTFPSALSPLPSSTSTSKSDPTPSTIPLFGSSTAPTVAKDSVSPFGTTSNSQSALAPSPTLFGGFSTTSNPFELSKPDAHKSSFGAPSKPDSSASVAASLFGQPSTTPSVFGTKPTDQPLSASSNPNPFGIPPKTTSKFGGFGGFGKPAGASGSIGNPVGFGFGSLPKTPDVNTSSGSAGAGFSFAKESEEKKADQGGGGESSQEGTSQGESEGGSTVSGANPNDEEGEGEENEETVHAIKLKAYKLAKKEGGSSAWSELGHGILRIKKHKDSGARRLLLRNSSTGKININFNIYAGLKPSVTKRTVMFVGHDEGASVTYNVRLQTEDQAKELKDILDREISDVKSKSES